MPTRVLMIFLDGVGVGSDDPDVNPLIRARLPTFAGLLGDQKHLAADSVHQTAHATLSPLDATLGLSGLPQSGTGQTALFTGFNAAQEFGRHFGPWVPTALRERLARENLLTIAAAHGRSVAFANAYPEELFANAGGKRTRDRTKTPVADPLRAGPPIVAIGAGVLNRHTDALMTGDAVASEITNDGWRKHLGRTALPIISPHAAGQNLARIAAQHDLTLFAHYSTDYVGHAGQMGEAVAALEKVDAFIAGVIDSAPEDLLIAIVGDHGNLEDIRAGHTSNPALGLFFGAGHAELAEGTTSLMDVTPRLLQLLGVRRGSV
jgi:hypothetical protein